MSLSTFEVIVLIELTICLFILAFGYIGRRVP